MIVVRTKESREYNKLEKRLRRQVGQAIRDFSMIDEGDTVMVCLSGGKDSYTLLDILLKFSRIAPVHFDLIAVNVDQGHPGFPQDILPHHVASMGIPFHGAYQNTAETVNRVLEPTATKCALCSRLRRGILYRLAGELGATKIALGHHRDDIIETFFLNLFFGGKLKAMPPKLYSDEGGHVVIRPLAYSTEEDIACWSTHRCFPIIPCHLCGSQENLQRVQIKAMLATWDKQHPGRVQTIFRSLAHIVPSHLLDRRFTGAPTVDPIVDATSLDALVSPIQLMI